MSPSEQPSGGNSQEPSEQEQERQTVIDLRRTAAGGVIATVIALTFSVAVGQVSAYEVPKLLAPIIDTLCYFCSAMCTASGTILALMLTALGLSAQSEHRFKSFHYRRLRFIARMATVVFVMAALLLFLIGIPLERADAIPRGLLEVLYYVITIYASVLCGVVVSTVLMLNRTVAETIGVVGLDQGKEHLIDDPD